MYEVKTIWFSRGYEADEKIAQYLNEGWKIVASGGGGDNYPGYGGVQGFVVLVREEQNEFGY